MSKGAVVCSFLTVLILTVCFLGLNTNIIKADTIDSSEEDDSEEEVSIISMVEEIRDGVTDIKDILQDTKEADENYYQESINEQKTMNDNLEGEDSSVSGDSNSIYDDSSVNSGVSDQDSEQVEEAPEEATTQNVGGVNDDNAENDAIYDETITKSDILELHSDLQKIMLSIWALAGLFLGSKLISRMFGNG